MSKVYLNDDHIVYMDDDKYIEPFFLDWSEGTTKIEKGNLIDCRKVESFSIKIPLKYMFPNERDAYEVVEQIVLNGVVYVIFGNHVTVKTDEYFHFYR